jgi:hypothetical protein
VHVIAAKMPKRKHDISSDSSEDSDSDSPDVRSASTPDNLYSWTRTADGEELAPSPSSDNESKQDSDSEEPLALPWFDRLPKTSADLLYPLTVGSANAEDLLKIEAVWDPTEWGRRVTMDKIKHEAVMYRVIVINNAKAELQCFAFAHRDWSIQALWVDSSVRSKGLGTAMCSIFESMAIAHNQALLFICPLFGGIDTDGYWRRQGLVSKVELASSLSDCFYSFPNSGCVYKLLVAKQEGPEEIPPHLEAMACQPVTHKTMSDMCEKFDVGTRDQSLCFDRVGIVLAIFSEQQQTLSEGVFEMADVYGHEIILHSTVRFHVEERNFEDGVAVVAIYILPLECTSDTCPPLLVTYKLRKLFRKLCGVARIGDQVILRKFRILEFGERHWADYPGLARVRPNDTTSRLTPGMPGIQVNDRQLTKPPPEISSIFPTAIAVIVMQYCEQFIPFVHDEEIRSECSSASSWKVEFQPQW